MNVSYQWLKEYIALDGLSPEELAEKLTRGGIEVDGAQPRGGALELVTVGFVKAKRKHPDADKLNVCTVDVGGPEELQIVCGAPNVDAGQLVPVAQVGAKLPGGLKIKRAKLRGVESLGMICSAKELGINDKLLPKEQQEGILVLPEGSEIGSPIAELLGLDDVVLELDLTPNRSDCLSLLGVAYELGALTGHPVRLPETAVHAASEQASERVAVGIAAQEACPHYAARYIKGVRVAPSPQWLQNRLIAAGVRPINNIVDITNYVLLEYGQPLHAFDADTVKGGRLDVRYAQPGERLTTLDGQARKLEAHMLVVADGERPVALAGVMGGADTEVTGGTVNIVLESACFDGAVVRRTSRELGLRSESSVRFEKQVDPARVIPALDRAASLMAELAGGLVADGIVQAGEPCIEPVTVQASLARINGLLGTTLSNLEVKTILGRLDFRYTLLEGDIYEVQVPSRRGDIALDVDVIEEIARLHGYDNIPTTPIEGATTPGGLSVAQRIRRALRQRMTGAGLHEAITYSFTSPARTALLPELAGDATPVRLAMPMSEERSVLRTGLVPGLLELAVYNRNRSAERVAVFEIGSVYLTDEATLTRQPQEKPRLAGLLTGARPAAWNAKPAAPDFYTAKGLVDAALELLGLADKAVYEPAAPQHMHPGRTAAVLLETERGRERVGYVGQLHPDEQRTHDLEDTYVFELELEPLCDAADFGIVYRQLPRYPSSRRDLAVVVDSGVAAGSLKASIAATAGAWLESVEVFDVYTGERLGAGKKSVALALVYRHPERTLTDEEIAELQERVVGELAHSFDAHLRA
ncbi:phenylalanine--tRNA ligase subunit beta [Paenibacillus sp. IB182496]|uniref:Phenylalanine--tRNA ligase beta subunit n=1 Tax=Paenibacillus sabuli TaxID=2772509 RepID=A0A927BY12_9BACL|nr:phenylalanine--tRNA ligase subunit beta [Paenibacillus sabuli]MBD2848452.1 phenylalanine--tRNA ligase subunit beta [Paenibacillus sabuli]